MIATQNMENPKQKITAIIQARMGASRLPNKVLLPLVGKPILWHINHRLKQCRRIDQIIIATSTNPLDDAIEEFAKREGIACYRGSEDDLLDRLYRTCEKHGVEVLIRVTADCPFVDSELIDELAEFYFQNQDKVDLVSNVHPPTFPDGLDLEIIPFRVLAETQFKLSNTFDREWFTTYLFEKAGYRQLNYQNNMDLSKLRWTLDTPEDYEFFKAVYGELFPSKEVFLKNDILELISRKPEIAKLNDKFERNYMYYVALDKNKDKNNVDEPMNEPKENEKKTEEESVPRVLIIGGGSMGKKHLQNLTQKFKCKVALCDAIPAVLEQAKANFPKVNTYSQLEEALAVEKPTHVIIATPNPLHLPLARKVLSAAVLPKSILIEKPLAHTLNGAEAFLEDAKKKNVQVFVGFNMRFHPLIKKVQELLQREWLGKIYSVKINFGSYLPERHPGSDYTKDYVTKEALGGGVILDVTHELDYLTWLFGWPEEVFSYAEKRSELVMETEDSADILLRFQKSDTAKGLCVANIHLDMLRRPYTRTCEILGEKGTILMDLATGELKVFNLHTRQWDITKFEFEHNDTYVEELQEFLGTNFTPNSKPATALSTGESAYKVLQIALTAKESAKKCQSIKLNLNENSQSPQRAGYLSTAQGVFNVCSTPPQNTKLEKLNPITASGGVSQTNEEKRSEAQKMEDSPNQEKNPNHLNRAKLKLTRSQELFQKAKQLIPCQTQTLSKGHTQFVQGVSPIFLQKGHGSHVWDVDGNEFIDYALSLGPITLGYNYSSTNLAVIHQLQQGSTFSLPHPLEIELAEELVKTIPCAEMVRYGKNGTDVTSAAIRYSRCFTGREKIACCGYHGGSADWYGITTALNKGIPKVMGELILKFEYNKIETLEKLFLEHPGEIAAVIMEPMVYELPQPGFLEKVKELAHKYGAVLIFDEMVTGFRMALGGAQEYFKVTPDLATFGKGVANGMPLSLLVGKREIMQEGEHTFFSMTFGGETLSLAAALSTIKEMREKQVVEHLWKQGTKIKDGYNKLVQKCGLDKYTRCTGLPVHHQFEFVHLIGGKEEVWFELKSLFLQETIERGILFSGVNNFCLSHSDADIEKTLQVIEEAFITLKKGVSENRVTELLRGPSLKPIFKRNP